MGNERDDDDAERRARADVYLPLLGAILVLLGLEASALWRGVR
jgi:hypothetical protein